MANVKCEKERINRLTSTVSRLTLAVSHS